MCAEPWDQAREPNPGGQPWGSLEAVSMSMSIVMLTAGAQGLKFLQPCYPKLEDPKESFNAHILKFFGKIVKNTFTESWQIPKTTKS